MVDRYDMLLTEVARGEGVSPATPWRWVLHGVRLRDGQVVRLKAVRCGGRYRTSQQALEEFRAALNSQMPADVPAIRTPAERRSAARKAADRMGMEIEA